MPITTAVIARHLVVAGLTVRLKHLFAFEGSTRLDSSGRRIEQGQVYHGRLIISKED